MNISLLLLYFCRRIMNKKSPFPFFILNSALSYSTRKYSRLFPFSSFLSYDTMINQDSFEKLKKCIQCIMINWKVWLSFSRYLPDSLGFFFDRTRRIGWRRLLPDGLRSYRWCYGIPEVQMVQTEYLSCFSMITSILVDSPITKHDIIHYLQEQVEDAYDIEIDDEGYENVLFPLLTKSIVGGQWYSEILYLVLYKRYKTSGWIPAGTLSYVSFIKHYSF